jgi:enolase
MKIQSVDAYQIFDSRGDPTVECVVTGESGLTGVGRVPSGASTGQYEALELRDEDPLRFGGRSVTNAIEHIRGEMADAILGKDVRNQEAIDGRLIELDGSPNKSRLGANAILAVSMAVADAASKASGKALYEHLGNGRGSLLPLPEIQIIGGGAHAHWRVDIQDFLLVVLNAVSYEETLKVTYDVYRKAGELLLQQGRAAGVADEGGYWPLFESNNAVLDFLVDAIDAAGYAAGRDCMISLDLAASDLYDGEYYRFRSPDHRFTSDEFIDLVVDWCHRYPIISVEDPLADSDWSSWTRLTDRLGDRVQIVGDDLFTTNPQRIRKGLEKGAANAVLIKLNQIGTVTETIAAIELTKQNGWLPIVSARSGETEDTFIAHLAVATNAGQIKVGSFARGERMAKWNELIRIDRALGHRAQFEGGLIYERILRR